MCPAVTPTRIDRPSTRVLITAAITVVLTCCHHFSIDGGGSVTAQEEVYPGQAKSERDLSTCKNFEICSVVHKRYWFPNRVERLCRCDGKECPNSWSELTDQAGVGDGYTMMMNNRAQMKFCEPVTTLPNCLDLGTSSESTSEAPIPAPQRFLTVVNETRTEIINNATVQDYKLTSNAQCFCPPHNTWTAHALKKNESATATGTVSYTWTSYRCSQLPKCKTNEVCGFERADFYSNYYRCSCPRGNVCTRSSQPITHQASVLLYEGPAFVTRCQSKP